jgi:hypothetical protein
MKFLDLINAEKKQIIDVSKDKFYQEIYNLIVLKHPDITTFERGSYFKLGKNKSCDLDFNQIVLRNKEDVLKKYLELLDLNQKELIFTEIKFNIVDKRIKDTLESIGFLSGNFDIIDYDLKINKDLPGKIKDKLKQLDKEFQKEKTIFNYYKIYKYLKDNMSPVWTIKDLKKGEITFNEKTYYLKDFEFDTLSVEVIYQNFPVSNVIHLSKETTKLKIKENKVVKKVSLIFSNGKLNHYKLIKGYQSFLKWLYFTRKIKEKYLVNLVPEIYQKIITLRDKLGESSHQYCYYKSLFYLNNKKEDEEKMNYYHDLLNEETKDLYDEIRKHYGKYVEEYLIFKN